MKNTLTDLNNHLFEQLERLNDDELDDAQLEKELKRAEGMTKVATQIIQNAELAYKTMVHMAEYGYDRKDAREVLPPMLEVKKWLTDTRQRCISSSRPTSRAAPARSSQS